MAMMIQTAPERKKKMEHDVEKRAKIANEIARRVMATAPAVKGSDRRGSGGMMPLMVMHL